MRNFIPPSERTGRSVTDQLLKTGQETRPTPQDEPPPFLGTWRRVYIAVICYLAVVIALFYWFARTFAA